MAFFQPYYQLDKNIEKDAIAKLKENYHTNLKGILPSIDYLRYIERTLKEIYQAGIVSTENIQQLSLIHISYGEPDVGLQRWRGNVWRIS